MNESAWFKRPREGNDGEGDEEFFDNDIEEVKRRRLEREKMMLEKKERREWEMRHKEDDVYAKLIAHEDEFELGQLEMKSMLRLSQGREQPIDTASMCLLAQHEMDYGPEIGIDGRPVASLANALATGKPQMMNPADVMEQLDLSSLQIVKTEIETRIKLVRAIMLLPDTEESDKDDLKRDYDFWKSLQVLCDASLRRLTGEGKQGDEKLKKMFEEEIEKIVHNKFNMENMEKEKKEVGDMLESSKGTLDHEFWSMVDDYMSYIVQRKWMSQFYDQVEKSRKERFVVLPVTSTPSSTASEVDTIATAAAGNFQESSQTEKGIPFDASSLADAWFRNQREKYIHDELENGEQVFASSVEEVPLTSRYKESDVKQFSPIKPRYIAKAKMVTEWNRYNRTHYDSDNPPPKTVQGYTFVIYYGSLFKKTETPKFFLEASNDPGWLILRFRASPPYEDIGFKIKNREWARGRGEVFRSTFEDGVLHLQFVFKRYRYRR